MGDPRTIDQIVELVQQLLPEQRRQLLQRLRVLGLLPPPGAPTDQNRLEKATALGAGAPPPAPPALERTPLEGPERVKGHGPPGGPAHVPGPNQPAPAPPPRPERPGGGVSAPLTLRFAGVNDAQGRRAGGKVVIGVPNEANEVDPHAMPPLPGQAPEQPISIIFDGGSKGNPGIGYGSYALRWPGLPQQIVQLQFGDGVTNNEAEYDTLAAALEAVVKRLRELKADPMTARVEIRGDSQLVINQVRGEWKCTEERMRRRRDHVRSLLREFGAWEIRYHPRENNVRILGH
jgi:ribonuclease HI